MEQEADIRYHVRVVLRSRRLVLALVAATTAIALVASFRRPAIYQAAALVVAPEPQYTIQLEPRIEAISDAELTSMPYPQLATSDEVLQAVLGRLDPRPEGVDGLGDLRGMLETKGGAEARVLQLVARSRSPLEAASVANAWAEEFVARANAVHGTAGEERARFCEGVAQQVLADLGEAEEALIDFQGRSQVEVLRARLASTKQELQDCLAQQAEIRQAVRKIESLRARGGDQSAATPVAAADGVAALLLEVQTLGLRPSRSAPPSDVGEVKGADGEVMAAARLEMVGADAAPVVQLQVSDSFLSRAPQTVGEIASLLDSLMMTLEDQAGRLEATIATLGAEIPTLKQRLERAEAEEGRLSRERDVLEEAHMLLLREAAEARIAAQEEGSKARLASPAVVPGRPAGPWTLVDVAVGGMLGLVLGVFVAFALEWWRGGAADAGSVKDDTAASLSGATAERAPDAGRKT